MLRLVSYDIVFQEIPGEVTLALNLSGCPNHCPGCHSPHLRQDIGEVLDDELLCGLLDRYGTSATCVCFMGGDADPAEVQRLAQIVQRYGSGKLKTGWYSGKPKLPEGFRTGRLDFIKLGPYVENLGGLDSDTTNQRFYRIVNDHMEDVTYLFRERKRSPL